VAPAEFADSDPGSGWKPLSLMYLSAAHSSRTSGNLATRQIVTAYPCGGQLQTGAPPNPDGNASGPTTAPGNNVTRGQVTKIIVTAARCKAAAAEPGDRQLQRCNNKHHLLHPQSRNRRLPSGYLVATWMARSAQIIPPLRSQIAKIVHYYRHRQ